MSSATTTSLQLIQQARQLQELIIAALTEGNREQAEQLCLQHQQLIESIPFRKLPDPIPAELSQALNALQAGNDQLVAVTTDIQEEIRRQLTDVQRGKAGSRAYSDVDRHQ